MKFTLSEEEHGMLMLLAEERGEPAAVLLREMIRQRYAARAADVKRARGAKTPRPKRPVS